MTVRIQNTAQSRASIDVTSRVIDPGLSGQRDLDEIKRAKFARLDLHISSVLNVVERRDLTFSTVVHRIETSRPRSSV